MSNEALTWAFAQPVVNASGRKFVLVALADKADETHSCWPSQATLARMTGQSERSIREHLKRLESDGYIARTLRRSAGGTRTSDRYTLAVSVAVGVVAPRPEQPADVAGRQPADVAGDLPADLAKATGRSRRVTQREPSTREPSPKTSRRTAVAADAVPSSDVLRLCSLLADLIEANGSKRPSIGKGWFASARLLLTNDGRTPEQVEKAIRWCQQDEFWRANVLSMPKLREKYDQLRLAAQQTARPRSASQAERDHSNADVVRRLMQSQEPSSQGALV